MIAMQAAFILGCLCGCWLGSSVQECQGFLSFHSWHKFPTCLVLTCGGGQRLGQKLITHHYIQVRVGGQYTVVGIPAAASPGSFWKWWAQHPGHEEDTVNNLFLLFIHIQHPSCVKVEPVWEVDPQEMAEPHWLFCANPTVQGLYSGRLCKGLYKELGRKHKCTVRNVMMEEGKYDELCGRKWKLQRAPGLHSETEKLLQVCSVTSEIRLSSPLRGQGLHSQRIGMNVDPDFKSWLSSQLCLGLERSGLLIQMDFWVCSHQNQVLEEHLSSQSGHDSQKQSPPL